MLMLGPDSAGWRVQVEGEKVALLERQRQTGDIRLDRGRINSHTHIYSGLAPLGMPAPELPPKNFLEILEKVWWRLDRAHDAETLRASARLYVAESLLAGTTTLIDHHESPELIEGSLDILAEACEQLGIRAVLCYGATERNGGLEEGRRGLAECRRFFERRRSGLVRAVVGLHASFTVSDELIVEAGELCRELGSILHVHLAEDGADVEDALKRGYPGPLERLIELGALPRRSIMAHGVHCSRDQVRRAEELGLWIVQNPRSNRGNGVGYPVALDASRRIAVGTDGYPSPMEDEASVLSEEAERHGESRLEVARRLEGGWRLASERFETAFAPLAPGAAADIVTRSAEGVRDVVVAGRRVVSDSRLLTGDLDEIRADARVQADRLWSRMARW